MMKEWVYYSYRVKKISEARNYLKLQFGKVYSTLVGDKPSSYLDLTLGELNSINVNFVGNGSILGFTRFIPSHL